MTKLFPNALLQWEDFAPGNGRRILQKYRNRVSAFNDDWFRMGDPQTRTGETAAASVILGAGTAGLGIADQIRDAMIHEGLAPEDASARFWPVDADGLLTNDMGRRLHDYQAPYARSAVEVKRWKRNAKRHRSGGGCAPSAAQQVDRFVDCRGCIYRSYRSRHRKAYPGDLNKRASRVDTTHPVHKRCRAFALLRVCSPRR